MKKDAINRTCRKLGLDHYDRYTIEGVEVQVWDGFVSADKQHWLHKRGLTDKNEHTMGCWITVAAALRGEDDVLYCPFNICEWNHDTELGKMKKQARVNSALERVKDEIPQLKGILNAH